MLKVKVALSPGQTSARSGRRLEPQVVLSAGFWEASLKPFAALQIEVPVFCMVMLTGEACPGTMEVGATWETKAALLTGAATATGTLVEAWPKLPAGFAMRHWKSKVPTAAEMTSKLNVTLWPAATALGSSTRFRPQLLLSCGLWLRR